MHAPKHADLIFDVGLHRGEDTAFYLAKGFRVVAIEANPELVSLCRARFAAFIDQGKLHIVEGAIVDPANVAPDQKTVTFYKNETGTSWGTVCSEWAERNERMGTEVRTLHVPILDFAAVLAEFGIPHYMKVDIEGCDLLCLKTLRKFVARPDYISFESDKVSFASIQHEFDLLSELGYEEFQAVEQFGIPPGHKPPFPAREGEFVEQTFELGSSGLFGAELPGKWMSRSAILRLYRMIFAGYRLLGDDGIMYQWQFRGASRLRRLVKRLLEIATGATVPGWYDTHARLSTPVAAQ
jgi:FkbM family methyltransferase